MDHYGATILVGVAEGRAFAFQNSIRPDSSVDKPAVHVHLTWKLQRERRIRRSSFALRSSFLRLIGRVSFNVGAWDGRQYWLSPVEV